MIGGMVMGLVVLVEGDGVVVVIVCGILSIIGFVFW